MGKGISISAAEIRTWKSGADVHRTFDRVKKERAELAARGIERARPVAAQRARLAREQAAPTSSEATATCPPQICTALGIPTNSTVEDAVAAIAAMKGAAPSTPRAPGMSLGRKVTRAEMAMLEAQAKRSGRKVDAGRYVELRDAIRGRSPQRR